MQPLRIERYETKPLNKTRLGDTQIRNLVAEVNVSDTKIKRPNVITNVNETKKGIQNESSATAGPTGGEFWRPAPVVGAGSNNVTAGQMATATALVGIPVAAAGGLYIGWQGLRNVLNRAWEYVKGVGAGARDATLAAGAAAGRAGAAVGGAYVQTTLDAAQEVAFVSDAQYSQVQNAQRAEYAQMYPGRVNIAANPQVTGVDFGQSRGEFRGLDAQPDIKLATNNLKLSADGYFNQWNVDLPNAGGRFATTIMPNTDDYRRYAESVANLPSIF